MFNINFKEQKGISILYAVFIVSILLAVSLGISEIVIHQVKMLSEIGHSVVAFYAADSGIEHVLVQRDNPPTGENVLSGTLGNEDGASYQVSVVRRDGIECFADNYCIRSIGTYKGTKRAIEIRY